MLELFIGIMFSPDLLAQTESEEIEICRAKQSGKITKDDYFSEYPTEEDINQAESEEEKEALRDLLKERPALMQVWDNCPSKSNPT